MQSADVLSERGQKVDQRYLDSAELVHDEPNFELSYNVDPHGRFPRGIDTVSSAKPTFPSVGPEVVSFCNPLNVQA
jgi:hypothetical protein